jgi:hypothetical protein
MRKTWRVKRPFLFSPKKARPSRPLRRLFYSIAQSNQNHAEQLCVKEYNRHQRTISPYLARHRCFWRGHSLRRTGPVDDGAGEYAGLVGLAAVEHGGVLTALLAWFDIHHRHLH